jgi:hypothetical protein
LEFSKDIEELIEILKIKKYSIIGVQNGGIYSLGVGYSYEKNIINSKNSKLLSINLISSDLPYSLLNHDYFSNYLKDLFFISKFFFLF